MSEGWSVESGPTGRIVVPAGIPTGFALFYTTVDFDGALDDVSLEKIRGTLDERFGVNAGLASCSQVHGVRVVDAGRAGRWCEHERCDALFTTQASMALGIKVADCLPVTLIDPVHSVMANIHSGWRGAVERIVSLTVNRLRAETSFEPADASAWLGPSIRACCFEVGDDVAGQFSERFESAENFIDFSRSKPHIDLAALTRRLLGALGVPQESIHDSGLCTRCEGSIFHSYRRNGPRAGRNLAIVAR